jgi:hypothetical protein
MMEVFIAFTTDDDFSVLESTLESWAKLVGEDNVIATQCDRRGKFQIDRRIVAEEKSTGPYYILADLGCVMDQENMACASRRMKFVDDSVGMIGLRPDPMDAMAEINNPEGVRICKKGAVQKWLAQSTDDYNAEHAASVKLESNVVFWPDVRYMTIRQPQTIN